MIAPPAMVAGGYGVVLCDPPWRFFNYSAAGEAKNPVAHYRCETTDDIIGLAKEIGLDFLCAPDCALAMWATFPMLPDALRVMAAWGFAYKSGGAWGKTTKAGGPAFGTGYIYRSVAELWLLGTRGSPKVLSHSVRNLILAERQEHSRKPGQMQDDLEKLYAGPYLELFARRPRVGWTTWGLEADAGASTAEATA